MRPGGFTEKFSALFGRKQPQADAPQAEAQPKQKTKFTQVLSIVGKTIYHLRKVFMAAPVVYYALKLAAYNMENLPEQVGINLQSTGEYAQMISRQSAVFGPLMVTAACLVMMVFSRRAVYPWLISIFSLALPLMVLITNLYPA